MSWPAALEKRLEPSPWLPYVLTALAIVSGLLLGTILLALMGAHPWAAYREMARGAFGSVYSLSETLVKATPLLLAGLGVGLAFRSGFWNIGAEGQLYMGAMGGTWVALAYPGLPAPLLQPLMIGVGCLAGAFWGLIPAVLRAYRRVNEIITTLMLNYIAVLGVDFLVYGPWKDPKAFGFPFTPPLPHTARLPALPGGRVHLGLLLGPLAAGVDSMTAGRGWIALAMVIFGAWNPARTALGAYLFGGVQALQLRLQAIGIAVPTYLPMMAPYAFTILALILTSGSRAQRRLGTPAALGTPYIRGG